jgi:hypothetical protein
MSQRAGHASKPNLLDLVLTSKQDNFGITCKAPSVVLTTADFAGLVSCMTVVTEQLVLAQIFGIRYGLRGFYDRSAKPVELNQKTVDGIHLLGGTILVHACPGCWG